MDGWLDVFSRVQEGLFESIVQPVAFALGWGNLLEQAYEGTGWVLVGLIQIAVMLLVIGPLQRWRPVEPVTDRRAVRVDVLYTLLHRLGLFKLVMFFTFENWLESGIAVLRAHGLPTFHLDQLWPGVTDQALVSFFLYLVVFDFINYWVHRAQHRFEWWWRLHALHHAQRQVTMWTDNRNHLLDSIIVDLLFVALAVLIGVPPGQFVALVAFSQLSESLQHANLRLSFGHIGERLWISPRFHRLHHAIGIGHEAPAGDGQRAAPLGGCNFGVLFPWWDMLLGTANFADRWEPTGVRDQVEQGRDYGDGFWSQQWLGLKRLVGRA
ncbi:sterol desaturase/sphingolipid hydroxylase (fatty acid hydroxylase superfamily) [Tibeticola sediminis]|uniref:Sterol desaturase/sphingolipid hydroxylase (Fatty acid hydroxylase superfamily) n=1 Tax=Tibeticola sediminis TaxID=1917811 RepID=A0A3N4UQK3_9BURK|nr:sterol desaturase family protein [Tibeticola sediminis]RPE72932.1 sterol desaturase/sphingolipid hydroxylase (fatty acid hydroxylase superfamily) [Tibeticola sediminis]